MSQGTREASCATGSRRLAGADTGGVSPNNALTTGPLRAAAPMCSGVRAAGPAGAATSHEKQAWCRAQAASTYSPGPRTSQGCFSGQCCGKRASEPACCRRSGMCPTSRTAAEPEAAARSSRVAPAGHSASMACTACSVELQVGQAGAAKIMCQKQTLALGAKKQPTQLSAAKRLQRGCAAIYIEPHLPSAATLGSSSAASAGQPRREAATTPALAALLAAAASAAAADSAGWSLSVAVPEAGSKPSVPEPSVVVPPCCCACTWR